MSLKFVFIPASGTKEPSLCPIHELLEKWEAWKRMGCLASEMESAALFIVGGFLRVRVGSVFVALANQERALAGGTKGRFLCPTGMSLKFVFILASGTKEPSLCPIHELLEKWEAWKRMGCLASEMESAALFIVGGFLRVRVGSVFVALANQERALAGMENPVVHDTDGAIRIAIEAIRELTKLD